MEAEDQAWQDAPLHPCLRRRRAHRPGTLCRPGSGHLVRPPCGAVWCRVLGALHASGADSACMRGDGPRASRRVMRETGRYPGEGAEQAGSDGCRCRCAAVVLNARRMPSRRRASRPCCAEAASRRPRHLRRAWPSWTTRRVLPSLPLSALCCVRIAPLKTRRVCAWKRRQCLPYPRNILARERERVKERERARRLRMRANEREGESDRGEREREGEKGAAFSWRTLF